MPREMIPPLPTSEDTPDHQQQQPILTASPEMSSPANPAGGPISTTSSEDKVMNDASTESSDENYSDIAEEDDEDEEARSEQLAYQLFRNHRSQNMEVELSQKFKNNDDLHPYVQVLSIADLDAVVALENAAFPEDQRASREKLIYRLTTCPFVCLGLFTSTSVKVTPKTQTLYDTARAPDSTKPDHKSLLIGHVIATLTTAPVVTEQSMEIPVSFPTHPDFDPKSASSTTKPVLDRLPSEALPDSTHPRVNQPDDAPGHHPLGRTIAIHSVAIHPAYQRLGFGKTMLKAYLQRMEGSAIADRAALLAKDKLVGFYVSMFGFEDAGESEVKFGGGAWRNLTYEFQDASHWS